MGLGDPDHKSPGSSLKNAASKAANTAGHGAKTAADTAGQGAKTAANTAGKGAGAASGAAKDLKNSAQAGFNTKKWMCPQQAESKEVTQEPYSDETNTYVVVVPRVSLSHEIDFSNKVFWNSLTLGTSYFFESEWCLPMASPPKKIAPFQVCLKMR